MDQRGVVEQQLFEQQPRVEGMVDHALQADGFAVKAQCAQGFDPRGVRVDRLCVIRVVTDGPQELLKDQVVRPFLQPARDILNRIIPNLLRDEQRVEHAIGEPPQEKTALLPILLSGKPLRDQRRVAGLGEGKPRIRNALRA